MTPPLELLSAVAASPEDDAPRLACADWLDEHGEADWAALVRAQVEMGRVALTTATLDRWTELLTLSNELEDRCRPARLAGLLAECPADRLHASWDRGFDTELIHTGTLTPAFLRALAGFPTVERVRHQPAVDVEPASEVGPEDVPLLAGATGLREATIRLSRPGLAWEHLEPLLALPRLTTLVLSHGGRDQLAGPLRRRWTLARAKAASARPAADALGAARAAFGPSAVGVTPAGDAAIVADLGPGRAALLSAVPRLRSLALAGSELPRQLAEWRDLRSLRLRLRGTPTFRPADWYELSNLRELVLETEPPGPEWDAVAECLAHLPDLRVLWLEGRGGPGVGQLPPLPELRVLRTGKSGPARGLAGRGWPRLLEWTAATRSPAFAALDPRLSPSLRLVGFGEHLVCVRPADGWGERLPEPEVHDAVTERRATLPGATERPFPAEGFSLRVPAWLSEEPPPSADPRTPEVVPLAAWREWGDDADGLCRHAPTRGRLDRIDTTGPAEDDYALLARPASIMSEHLRYSEGPHSVRRREGDTPRSELLRPNALAGVQGYSVRHLWRAPGRAYRLVWEGGRDRLLGAAGVAALVADTWEWAG